MNYKLIFKYLLLHTSQIFFKCVNKNTTNTNIFITETTFYFLCLHLKLTTACYATQLVDIFSYELPINLNTLKINPNTALTTNSIVVYNFHSIFFQQRFYVFVTNYFKQNINATNLQWTSLQSITELFLNANWLERELAELHGIFFSGKKDLRNLMLQYGDTSAPFKKSFPSIGVKEVFYDALTDTLTQSPVSVQF